VDVSVGFQQKNRGSGKVKALGAIRKGSLQGVGGGGRGVPQEGGWVRWWTLPGSPEKKGGSFYCLILRQVRTGGGRWRRKKGK